MRRLHPRHPILVAVIATLGLTLGLGLAPVPAEAAVSSPYTFPDPRDAFRAGDIRNVSVTHGRTHVVIVLTTQAPLSKTESPAWTALSSTSHIFIPIDTGGSGLADFRIEVLPSVIGAYARIVARPSGAERCFPFLTQPTAAKIRLRFERSCIDSPANLRLFNLYRLDRGGNGSIESEDRAPNAGWTPRVAKRP